MLDAVIKVCYILISKTIRVNNQIEVSSENKLCYLLCVPVLFLVNWLRWKW